MLLINPRQIRPGVATDSPAVVLPQLTFEFAGVERTLNKHPQVQAALRAGTMTLAQAMEEPWQMRVKLNGRERYFKLAIADKDAIRGAKDILRGRTEHAGEFSAFLAQRDARRGVTLGTLAAEWIKAGLPFSKTKPRKPEAAKTLCDTLNRALEYWGDKIASSVTPPDMEDFVVWKRKTVRPGARFTGSRTSDLQLGAMSCLCQWAVLNGKLKENPFAIREKFTSDVKHCHQSMPGGDEQFHQILDWLFTHPVGRDSVEPVIAGAYLAFSALTGLRPGEGTFIQRCRVSRRFPANFAHATVGQIYLMPDRTWRMKVQRLKNGQNPAIVIHPALRDFLKHWNRWLNKNKMPIAAPLFPDMDEDRARDYLARACAALNLPAMKPHGFGRAYYVRVRRSQGMDDTAISVELGQTTNGKLIRDTYGDPLDPVGGNLHDWLPANRPAAWTRF